MAALTHIFVQVFAVSFLLASLSSTTNAADEIDDNEELDAWLESLLKTLQPAFSGSVQEQKPADDFTQEQQQQPSYYFTEEQSDYIKNLFATQKLDNLNNNLQQELKNHLLQTDSDEETDGQTTPETGYTSDDSDEEEPVTEPTTESTTTPTTTTTEEATVTPLPDSDEETDGQTTQETGYTSDDSDEEESVTEPTTESTTTTTTTTTEEATVTPLSDSDEETDGQTTQETGYTSDDSDEEESATEPTTESTTTTTTTEETTVTPIPVCFGYKPDADVRYYYQYTGLYWLKRSCPYGYGFDYNACACSIKLESTPPVVTFTTTTTPEATTTTTTTQKVITTVKPSLELCNDCVILHGVGYAPFPGYCDAYIQCRFYGDVPTAISIRHCPSGYYWNQDKLTCDFQDNVKCVSVNNCPNHKAIAGDWAAYLIFDGQSWTRVSCPSSTTYNSITCGCTDKHDTDDSSHEENCNDKKIIPGDKTGYLQLTGSGWVRMPCPATLGYNEQTCGCTEHLVPDTSYSRCPDKKSISGDKSGFLQFNGVSWIRIPCPRTLAYNPESCICSYDQSNDTDNDDSESKDDDLCKSTVTLTFDNDDATDSSVNHFWVNNTGVTFKDGKAYFNGKSRLTIPGLSNMEFGSTVYIFIKYRHTSASSQETLIANGDCQVRQSLAVCSGKESVDFYAETTQQISLAKVTVPSDIGTWQSAVYALEKDNLQGSVGDNKVSQLVKGPLDRRQRGIVIGGGGNCDNFHGIIDEVQVFLCKPNFVN